MKRRNLFCFLFLLCIFSACNNNDKKLPGKTEDDINVTTEFIRSALDGKFDQAKTYLLPDSSNIHYIETAERNFEKADVATKDGYRESTIHIHKVAYPIKDSVTIVVYSNSFKNDHDTLRVIKIKDQWLVDLKYLYEHDMDTMKINSNNRDILK